MILMTLDENVTIPTDLKSQIRTETYKDLKIRIGTLYLTFGLIQFLLLKVALKEVNFYPSY